MVLDPSVYPDPYLRNRWQEFLNIGHDNGLSSMHDARHFLCGLSSQMDRQKCLSEIGSNGKIYTAGCSAANSVGFFLPVLPITLNIRLVLAAHKEKNVDLRNAVCLYWYTCMGD